MTGIYATHRLGHRAGGHEGMLNIFHTHRGTTVALSGAHRWLRLVQLLYYAGSLVVEPIVE